MSSDEGGGRSAAWMESGDEAMNWLLVFIPVAIVLDWVGANPILVFSRRRWRSFPWPA